MGNNELDEGSEKQVENELKSLPFDEYLPVLSSGAILPRWLTGAEQGRAGQGQSRAEQDRGKMGRATLGPRITKSGFLLDVLCRLEMTGMVEQTCPETVYDPSTARDIP